MTFSEVETLEKHYYSYSLYNLPFNSSLKQLLCIVSSHKFTLKTVTLCVIYPSIHPSQQLLAIISTLKFTLKKRTLYHIHLIISNTSITTSIVTSSRAWYVPLLGSSASVLK